MKKFTFLAAVAVVLTVFNGCIKDDTISKNGLPDFVSTKYESEYGKYQKELLVYDQSGNNSILLLIHSDIEGTVEDYLNKNDLELMLEVDQKGNSLKSATIGSSNSNKSSKATIPDEILKRQVSVELITENIQEHVKNYYLNVKSKELQLKDFIFDQNYDVFYSTTGNFIGVSNYGYYSSEDKYDIACYLEKKPTQFFSGWDILWQGFLQGDVGDYSPTYYAQLDYTSTGNPWYKIGALLYTDPRVPAYNFLIAYSKSSFRGHSCTIGSYDAKNCYVGTPPTGTTAFINYNPVNGDVYFYYTPLPGNSCPIGLGFDGANCTFLKVPSNCEPFITANRWYVKPNLIN